MADTGATLQTAPERLMEDSSSDVYMRRDLVLAALTPSLLYRVKQGLRRFRARLGGHARPRAHAWRPPGA
jgi:hypothetical protein